MRLGNMIGQVVWFWPADSGDGKRPFAAIVNDERHGLMSLTVFEHTGGTSLRPYVPLLAAGGQRPNGDYCCELN